MTMLASTVNSGVKQLLLPAVSAANDNTDELLGLE